MRLKISCIIFLGVLLLGCNNKPNRSDQEPLVKGVYGNPAALWKAGYDFPGLGINAVFIRSGSLDSIFINRARKERVRIYVEFPVLNGKEYLAAHPEAWPVTDKGERAGAADWFMGICPTDPGFRSDRQKALANLLSAYAVDGIWLDYFHWHAQFERPDPILPETCFCERCLHLFENFAGLKLPAGTISERAAWILTRQDAAWRKWRASVLVDWARTMNQQIKQVDKKLLTGIFHCGWMPAAYDSALYKKLGLDLAALAEEADVLSPMLFHQLMGRPESWVGEYMSWLSGQSWLEKSGAPGIWPIVQGYNGTGVVDASAFKQVLEYGLLPPSGGVMPFSAESIAGDTAKLRSLREVYKH
jgi:hypothetical protein